MNTRIIRLEETDSTNRYLKSYIPEADEEMTVVVADYQSAGKGQGTHSWESERGKNLLFSILVHPHWVPVARQFMLSMAGALALKDALDSYVEGITLKWPNDVYWNDKKISGTLIENSIDSHGIKRCVFGIGVNINQAEFHSDAPNPVSLFQILGYKVDREEVLQRSWMPSPTIMSCCAGLTTWTSLVSTTWLCIAARASIATRTRMVSSRVLSWRWRTTGISSCTTSWE